MLSHGKNGVGEATNHVSRHGFTTSRKHLLLPTDGGRRSIDKSVPLEALTVGQRSHRIVMQVKYACVSLRGHNQGV